VAEIAATAAVSGLHRRGVESVLLAACVLAGATLRLHQLGAAPLSAGEATQAWPAWTVALGASSPAAFQTPVASALLFTVQSCAFWLVGGGGDAVARAPAAVVGSAMVLLPWLLRPVLGPVTALILSVVLAVDPVLVRLSRTADGAILTAFAALLVLACVLRAAGPEAESTGDAGRWRAAAAVGLGLTLVSGPHAWSVAIVAGVTLMALGTSGRRRLGVPHAPWRLAFRPAVLSAGLGASGLLLRPETIAAVGTSLTGWTRQWTVDGTRAAGLQATVEQPLLVALALLGIVVWPRADRRLGVALAMGGVVAGTFACAPGPTRGSGVPLILVLGCAAAPGIAWITRPEARRGPRAVVVAAAAVLLILTARGGAGAVHDRLDAEHGRAAAARELARDVATLSAWRAGDRNEHRVDVVADPGADPLIGWYLRHLRQLRWILAADADLASRESGVPMIVTPARNWPTGAPPVGYAVTRYPSDREATDPDGVLLWVPAAEAF
jgi:hypothetical protein